MKLIANAALPTASAACKRVNVLFDEQIVKITTDTIVSEDIAEVIDLGGKMLLPGGVDAHSHIIAEGDPAKTLARITRAALSGGWTTLAELSYFNPQPIFAREDLRRLAALIKAHSHVDMAVWGNVNIGDYPYHAEAALELWNRGTVGLALTHPSPNPAITALSFTEIMDLFLDIYESDTAFAFQGWVPEPGAAFSFTAQSDAIKKLLRRMQENPIHIPRVASFATIEFINSISKRSDISFSLCLADLMQLYSGIPGGLRADLAGQQDLLFELLRTNKIYMLSNNVESPTAPANRSEAFRGVSEACLAGSYLWALSELWAKRKVPLATVIKMTSENAAKRLGLYPTKGCLEAGSDADFLIFDPQRTTAYIAPDGSKHEFQGAIDSVFLRGKRVLHKGKAAPATGAFVARSATPKRRHNNTTWI
ncbi:MAG TPA: amidohydrolase family protein [Candidatus Syntrophosphaera sp.]|nr:amidohydrolase family protein [Candidatus Syntrophosphaera sp.]